jgi:hypothetical protein
MYDIPGVTKSGIIKIVMITVIGFVAVFFTLYKAGLSVARLVESLIIGIISIFLVLYIIILTISALTKRPDPSGTTSLYGKRALLLMRIFSLACMAVLLFMAYDIIIPASKITTAVILAKSKTRQGDRRIVLLEDGVRRERAVTRTEFLMLAKEDTLSIKKSMFFENWKQALIIRNGKVVGRMQHLDNLAMAGFGVLLFIPLLSFLMGDQETAFLFIRRNQFILFIIIPIIELVAVLLLVHLLLVRLGVQINSL